MQIAKNIPGTVVLCTLELPPVFYMVSHYRSQELIPTLYAFQNQKVLRLKRSRAYDNITIFYQVHHSVRFFQSWSFFISWFSWCPPLNQFVNPFPSCVIVFFWTAVSTRRWMLIIASQMVSTQISSLKRFFVQLLPFCIHKKVYIHHQSRSSSLHK